MSLMQRSIASGTPYTLTATAAQVALGSVSPAVTLTAPAGTKRVLRARAVIDLVGVTFSAEQSITLKLRKTSGTAADLADTVTTVKIGPIASAQSGSLVVNLPTGLYTVSSVHDDVIQLWASVSALPGAGSLQIREAEIDVESD